MALGWRDGWRVDGRSEGRKGFFGTIDLNSLSLRGFLQILQPKVFFGGYIIDPSTPTVYNWLKALFSKCLWIHFEESVAVQDYICHCHSSIVSNSYFLCLVRDFITYCREIFFACRTKTRREERDIGTIQLNSSYFISFTIQFLSFLFSDFPVILAKFNLSRQSSDTVKTSHKFCGKKNC